MQPHLAPKTKDEIIAMLTSALLVAHRHLIQRGGTPSAVTLPVEAALFETGISLHQMYINAYPDAANDPKKN
jgi:hypothetical protein